MSKPVKNSEPTVRRNPCDESEPLPVSKPPKISEPSNKRKPFFTSEPL